MSKTHVHTINTVAPGAAPNLTPSNWYQIFKRATQLGYTNIWDFLESMKK